MEGQLDLSGFTVGEWYRFRLKDGTAVRGRLEDSGQVKVRTESDESRIVTLDEIVAIEQAAPAEATSP